MLRFWGLLPVLCEITGTEMETYNAAVFWNERMAHVINKFYKGDGWGGVGDQLGTGDGNAGFYF